MRDAEKNVLAFLDFSLYIRPSKFALDYFTIRDLAGAACAKAGITSQHWTDNPISPDALKYLHNRLKSKKIRGILVKRDNSSSSSDDLTCTRKARLVLS